MSNRFVFAASLALLAILLANFSLAEAQQPNKSSKKRRHQNAAAAARAKQDEATLRAARAQKAAAESKASDAKERLDATLKKLKEESDQLHDAQSTVRHLAKELTEIEQEILEEQTRTSPYTTAANAVETARAALTKIENRILAESDVQSQLAGLSGVRLVEKQTSILSLRADYIPAKANLDAAGANVARIRDELFQADADWKEASEALAEARLVEQKAEADTRGPTSGRISTAKTAKTADEAAAQARAAIAQADRVIKSIENKKQNDKKNDPPRKK